MRPACMIVLTSIASCVFCYPSKPLNERSTELTWEAWLLVDQSNRQSDLGLLRRRITPKSVFIAPTFSPESLPPCPEGYKSDPLGRCIKIIKINESIHFDFLLQKLNERFPSHDEGREETHTKGPLQFNIPLLGDDDSYENETDIAIVVAPTNKNRDKSATTIKVDSKKNGDKFDVQSVAAILGVKPEDVEMTTIAALTTAATLTTTRTEETTFETSTLDGAETTGTVTPDEETTALLEGDAIYFRLKI